MSNITAHGFDILGPGTALTPLYSTFGGSVPAGTYSYKVSYETHFGETLCGPASAPIVNTGSAIGLSNIPIRPEGNVIGRRLYRSNGGPFQFLAEISDNRTTTYVDKIAGTGANEPDAAFASSIERELGWTINTRPAIVPVATITASIPYTDIDQYTECAFASAPGPGLFIRMPPVTTFQQGMRIVTINTASDDITILARTGTTIGGMPSQLLVAGTAMGWTYVSGDWLLTETAGTGGGGAIPTFSAGTTGLTPAVPTAGPIVLGGIVNVPSGGTGQSSLTQDALLAGNGTLPIQTLPITYNGATLTDVPNPINLLDVANKAYVDGIGSVGVSLDPNGTPTQYPTDASGGVWYGLDTRANTFDQTCTTIGRSAATVGINATAVGIGARAGANSIAIGVNAAPLVTGTNNIMIGPNIVPLLTTGTNNTTCGHGIVLGAASNSNVIYGHTVHTTSDGNVMYGRLMGNSQPHTNNVFVGTSIANFVTTANDNVIMGRNLASALTIGSGNVIIGRNNDVSAPARSGCVMIGSGLTATADNATYIQHRAPAGNSTLAGWQGNELVEITGTTFTPTTPAAGASTVIGTYTAQTVGATFVDIYTIATANNTAYAIRGNFALGSTPDAGAIHVHVRCKNIAGVLTLSPLIVDSISVDIGIANADIVLAQTGTTLHVQALGHVARTIKWCGYIETIATGV